MLLDVGSFGSERKLYREHTTRFGHHLAWNWNHAEEIFTAVMQIEEFAIYFKGSVFTLLKSRLNSPPLL
jgi:hypothetical protein